MPQGVSRIQPYTDMQAVSVEAEDDEFRWYIKSLQGEYVRKGSFVPVMRYNIGLITYPDSALLFYISYLSLTFYVAPQL